MSRFAAVARKELRVIAGSPRSYLVLALFALTSALLSFEHLRLYNQTLFLYTTTTLGGFDLDTLPDSVNMRFLVFLPLVDNLAVALVGLVPLVTMRFFAEERSRGTDGMMLVTGVGARRIVAAKFLCAWIFVSVAIVALFLYPALVVGRGGMAVVQLGVAFSGLWLHATALTGIGLAASALSRSQLAAAALAWAAGFVLWDLSWLAGILPGEGGAWLDALSLQARYGGFSDGVVAVHDAVFFLSWLVAGAAVARFSYELRRVTG